jgi:hypothetical protein
VGGGWALGCNYNIVVSSSSASCGVSRSDIIM